MSDLIDRIAEASQLVKGRTNHSAHRLARCVDAIQREAFRLADLGVPADTVALVVVAIENVVESPAYRESRAALDWALALQAEYRENIAREDREALEAGREALAAKRLKTRREARRADALSDLALDSPDV